MNPSMMENEFSPVRLTASQHQAVTRVLSSAFHEYPVMRYVLREASEDYERQLHSLIEMFVAARVLRNEPILGILEGGEIAGVALVSDPDGPPTPPEFATLRDAVWAELGSAAQQRYEEFGAACKPLTVNVPHLHLNMIGVRLEFQGQGLSSRLLEAVHRLAREKPGSHGVTLTTENAVNLSLYQHFGYQVIGHASVDAGLETWGLFRPN